MGTSDPWADFELSDNGGVARSEPIPDAKKQSALLHIPPGFKLVTPEEVQAWAESYKKPANGNAPPEDGCFERDNTNGGTAPGVKPTIVVMPGDLPQVVDAAEGALIEADLGLYRRGTTLVRPAMATIKISDGRETKAQCVTPLSAYALAEAFTRAASWLRPKKGQLIPTDCPLKVAKTYLDRVGDWTLPVLSGVISAPMMREDGSLLDQPGYDERTGLLFDPQGCEFLPVAEKPAREDAWQALAVVKDLLRGFPFVSDADRSVAVSAILTAVVRRSLASAPLHGFTAPVAGSGKSMLVDIASIIATGHEAAAIEEGDEDELPKRLGSARRCSPAPRSSRSTTSSGAPLAAAFSAKP